MKAAQEQITSQANQKIGMPAITRFQEKAILKMIYELRDKADLQTYVYLFAQQTGKIVYVGRAIGYGIPYATQYSNPEKRIDTELREYRYNLPQSEPNGLYMPSSADGTWVLLIGPDNQPHPTYFEPDVIVSPFKLEVN
jgi:hypothetical protein